MRLAAQYCTRSTLRKWREIVVEEHHAGESALVIRYVLRAQVVVR